MKASAINPVCIPAAGFGRARSQSVCALPIVWGVFSIKEFKLTTKGQIECAQQQDARRFCSRVFLYVSVCDRFKSCRVFEPVSVCVFKSPMKFYIVSMEKNWGQVYFTISTSGLSRCFDSQLNGVCDLQMKRKKNCFSYLSAGKCVS